MALFWHFPARSRPLCKPLAWRRWPRGSGKAGGPPHRPGTLPFRPKRGRLQPAALPMPPLGNMVKHTCHGRVVPPRRPAAAAKGADAALRWAVVTAAHSGSCGRPHPIAGAPVLPQTAAAPRSSRIGRRQGRSSCTILPLSPAKLVAPHDAIRVTRASHTINTRLTGRSADQYVGV